MQSSSRAKTTPLNPADNQAFGNSIIQQAQKSKATPETNEREQNQV
jgi:hypothetical protein